MLAAVALDDPNAQRLLAAYFDELRVRFGGFEPPSQEALEADARSGIVLVAFEGGVGVACGSLRRLDADTLEVKRMFVTPGARGKGHGRRMLRALEEHARILGCRRIVLDTAGTLLEAASLYRAEGYVEIERYNDNPHAARWFEKRT